MPSPNTEQRPRPQLKLVGGPATEAPDARGLFRPDAAFGKLTGPALLFDRSGPLAWNAAAAELHETPDLLDLATKAIRNRIALKSTIAAPIAGQEALIEFEAAPWAADTVLLLGRDVTADVGVREALLLSRERYRALLDLAADVFWEAGPDGGLELLAPNTLYGRAAAGLIGMQASKVIEVRAPGFHAGDRAAVWTPATIQRLDGRSVAGAAIAAPMIDPETGRRAGMRGCFREAVVLTQPDD